MRQLVFCPWLQNVYAGLVLFIDRLLQIIKEDPATYLNHFGLWILRDLRYANIKWMVKRRDEKEQL